MKGMCACEPKCRLIDALRMYQRAGLARNSVAPIECHSAIYSVGATNIDSISQILRATRVALSFVARNNRIKEQNNSFEYCIIPNSKRYEFKKNARNFSIKELITRIKTHIGINRNKSKNEYNTKICKIFLCTYIYRHNCAMKKYYNIHVSLRGIFNNFLNFV